MTGLNNTAQANDANLGVVHVIRAKVEFTVGTGNAVSIGKVPAKALVVDTGVGVTTGFNAATTAVIAIGPASDPDGIAAALDVKTAVGLIQAATLATSDDIYNTSDTEYFATYTETGAAASAGVGYAYIAYVLGND